MLAPQALEGVGAVALLYAGVKRSFGVWAGLGAGVLFALTPVAALMFRFNNPDALLVLALVAAAYCVTRALEHASTRWVLGAGALVGLAFLAKMGQAFLVMPGFALAYLCAAPTSLRRRFAQLLAGLGVFLLSAGWWVAIVALLPAAERPYIDGSPSNSILDLIFNYNGFGRLFGSGQGGGGAGASFSGATGILRLTNSIMGGQAAWLLPLSLAALIGGLWARRRAPRADHQRAALISWGGWLLVTAAVFSFSKGTIHSYYTIALAPAIAALSAIGASMLWQARHKLTARIIAASATAASAAWAITLLDRTPSFQPWLRPLIITTATLATIGLIAAPATKHHTHRTLIIASTLAAITILTGPTAYTINTITTPHTGALVSAGPTTSTSGFGGFGGGRSFTGTARPTGSRTGGAKPPSGMSFGRRSGVAAAGSAPGTGATSVSAALVSALESNSSSYRWVAATNGSTSAASYELATKGLPVMAIGGFTGSGGNLTLAAFKSYVAKHEIHYYISGGGRSGSNAIANWVAAHYKATTIGGTTVYDLSGATG